MSDVQGRETVEAVLAGVLDAHPMLSSGILYMVTCGGTGPECRDHFSRGNYRDHVASEQAAALRAAGVDAAPCECVGYTIRTDYGTGVEHDVDRSSCPIHAGVDDDATADMEPCAEFGQHPRGGHDAAARASQEPPVDAQGGGGNEDTPDDAATQAVEGAVPGDVYRTPADWPERQPTSSHRAAPEPVEQADDGLRERIERLTYQSDDGTEYEHNGHAPHEGEPECPGCWGASIRAALTTPAQVDP